MSFGIPLDKPHRFKANLVITDPEDATALKCIDGSIDVNEITLTLEMIRTQGSAPIDRLYEYTAEDGGILAQGFDVLVPDTDGSAKLAFHRSGDGKRFSIQVNRDSATQMTQRRPSPIFWTTLSSDT